MVVVIGPESSGSVMVSKIIGNVIGASAYGKWTGYAWSPKAENELRHKNNVVLHRSFPNGKDYYLDVDKLYNKYKNEYDIKFVITTRDKNIVKLSKQKRFGRDDNECKLNNDISKEKIKNTIDKYDFFIWSYETFLYLEEIYLYQLYEFLNVESDFIPNNIFDGNEKYINKPI